MALDQGKERGERGGIGRGKEEREEGGERKRERGR